MRPLTERQAEIVAYVARGLADKQIASETGLTIDTVRHHIQNASARLPGTTAPRHKLTLHFFLNEPKPEP